MNMLREPLADLYFYSKKESPKGEATTTSDYFATNGKSKPARTSPVRAKPTKKEVEKDTTFAVQISPKATPIRSKAAPKADIKSSKETNESPRVSTRKKPRKSYAEEDDGFGDAPIIKLDDDSGEDIFSAEYKRPGKKMEDDYESDDDAFETVKPTRDVRRNGVKASPAASNTQKPQVADVVMKDESDSEVTAPKKKLTNGAKPAKGRKRKSAELSDDEDEDNIAPRAKKSAAKPSPAKRTKAPKVDDVQESKEMQDIFDSIPTIRPPTPPPRDPSKKFDFKAQAQRSTAAPASGTKEIPTGAENCLAGLAFVFTGILDTLDRDSGIELVKRYGGKVTGAPSSKTSYVVLGNDAGPKKLETIAKFKLKTINEDGLFALISKLPANGGDSKAAGKFEEKKKAEEDKIREAAEAMEREEKANAKKAAASAVQKPSTATSATKPATKVDDQLWTVKYAPTSANQICGNKAQVDKLQAWLRSFPENLRTHFKKPGKDGSGTFRAVMIYGGPGIGKTTAAHLAAKLEGYDIVESNASDTRSKKLVETGLKGVLDTTSLLGYFSGDGKKVEAEKKKLVLIMDEVDGMSAGDRGGVGALAAVCKKTRVPMILICNDRRLPKMKPFDRIVFDLPFRKPTVDQVRSRIMTIIYREGMRDIIPTTVVNALIEGSRSDIRQIINMISTAKVDQQALDFDGGKKMTKAWEKHVILRPWDIVQKILGGGMFAQSSTATLNEKIELYFNDHEFSSLMLQENYLGTSPILLGQYNGKERNLKNLELVDKAAESISDGDLVDRMIHGSQQQWSLMPTHAVFSFVRPASFVSGSLAGHGQIRFTSWLGNNSKLGKWLNISIRRVSFNKEL
jgi:replication factor C subunit 1